MKKGIFSSFLSIPHSSLDRAFFLRIKINLSILITHSPQLNALHTVNCTLMLCCDVASSLTVAQHNISLARQWKMKKKNSLVVVVKSLLLFSAQRNDDDDAMIEMRTEMLGEMKCLTIFLFNLFSAAYICEQHETRFNM